MSLANKLAASGLAVCLAVTLTSCDAGLTAPDPGPGGGAGAPSSIVRLATSELLLVQGETAQLDAQVVSGSGSPVPGPSFSWSSSAPEVVSVSGSGVVSALRAGDAIVTAAAGQASASARVRVSGRTVVALRVSPQEDTLGAIGATVALSAAAMDSKGSPVAEASIRWASLDPEVAVVDDGGLVTSIGSGIARITAEAGDQQDTVRVHVYKRVAPSLRVRPREVVVDALGDSLRLVADDAPASAVKWTSLKPGVASVSASGMVVAKGVGVALIVAKHGEREDTARVEVRQLVSSLSLTPAEPVVQAGLTQAMKAAAKDANGNAIPGVVFSWMSSNPGVATVDREGTVRALAAGVTYVTAGAAHRSVTATVTVTPAPAARVGVSPATVSLVPGGTASLAATAEDAEGNPLAGRAVAWSTSAEGVATVSESGVVTAVAEGSATITATVDGKKATTAVKVKPGPDATAARIAVTPATDTLDAIGASTQLVATVYSATGSAMAGATSKWSSLDAAIATVDAKGKVVAKAAGAARIVASSGTMSDTARVVVRQVVAKVEVSPTSAKIESGATLRLGAKAKDANGYVIAGAAFEWTASNPAAVSVDGTGLVKGVAAGVSYVTAATGGKTATATLTVTAPAVASVEVSPVSATVEAGRSVPLTAAVRDASGQLLSGRAVSWSTSSAAVATVSASGMVTGVSAGKVTITATSEGRTGSAQVTVTAPPVAGPALAFQDDFEAGALAAVTANGYRWRGAGANAGSAVSVSRDIARSGSGSLKFVYEASSPCTDSSAEQRFEFGENLQEVWLEYYLYIPSGKESFANKFQHRTPTKKNSDGSCSSTPDVSDNNKFLRLWDLDYNKFHVKAGFEYRATQSGLAGDSRLYGMWGSDTKAISNWDKQQTWDLAITDANRGRWVQIRVRAKVADSKSVSNGVLQLWTDGVLRINLTGLDLAASAGGNNFFRNGYLMGWANTGFDRNTAVYVDDFRIYRANPGW